MPIRDLVLQNHKHKKMERGDRKRLQGRVYGSEKERERKKKKDMKEEINDFHILALLL